MITKVEPDAEVKQSMNEINAAQRKRVAAQELAEADKIKIVTAAEAEAEKDRLHGVGIAQQRKAIVDGLAESITELKEANVGMTEEQIMSILLTNQYLDTLNTFASKGNQTIFYQIRQMVWMISVHKSCQPFALRRNNRLKSLATGSFCVALVALRIKILLHKL